MLLAGDIGGTKTILAIYADDSHLSSPKAEATFPSAEFDSLEAIVEKFLSNHPQPIERACFGVAGPVIDGHANITNLPWRNPERRAGAHDRCDRGHRARDRFGRGVSHMGRAGLSRAQLGRWAY